MFYLIKFSLNGINYSCKGQFPSFASAVRFAENRAKSFSDPDKGVIVTDIEIEMIK